MTKLHYDRAQQKQLSNGCLNKRAYKSEEAAASNEYGQKAYLCLYCNQWHRTSVKPSRATKHGIPSLKGRMPPKKPKSPAAPDKHKTQYEKLRADYEARGREIHELHEALARHRAEKHRLRMLNDFLLRMLGMRQGVF